MSSLMDKKLEAHEAGVFENIVCKGTEFSRWGAIINTSSVGDIAPSPKELIKMAKFLSMAPKMYKSLFEVLPLVDVSALSINNRELYKKATKVLDELMRLDLTS